VPPLFDTAGEVVTSERFGGCVAGCDTTRGESRHGDQVVGSVSGSSTTVSSAPLPSRPYRFIVIRPDEQPAQIDFVVLPQPGRISKGIFRFDGGTLVVKAPESGLPRPGEFKEDSGPIAYLRLSRAE